MGYELDEVQFELSLRQQEGTYTSKEWDFHEFKFSSNHSVLIVSNLFPGGMWTDQRT